MLVLISVVCIIFLEKYLVFLVHSTVLQRTEINTMSVLLINVGSQH